MQRPKDQRVEEHLSRVVMEDLFEKVKLHEL